MITKKNVKGLASHVVHYSVADWPDVIAGRSGLRAPGVERQVMIAATNRSS